jgi:hypothetical protein
MKPLAVLLASLALLAVSTAFAAAGDPAPTPCNGMFVKDPAGDQIIGPVTGGFPLGGTPATSKGPDNLDIKGLFFNTVNGVTTANIQITNLDQSVPMEFLQGKFSYIVDFDDVGDIAWVRAEVSADAVTYHMVKRQTVGVVGANIGNEDITGKFFPGPDGIVQIDLPPATFKPGLKLANVYAYTSQRTNDNFQVGYINDSAPDTGATAAKNYTITECPAPGAAGALPVATPTPAPGGGSGGGGGGQTSPAPGSSQPAPPPGTLPASGLLTADVAADKGKRKTAAKRGLRVRVRCSVQCTAGAVATIDKKTARKLKLGKKAMTIGTGKATITKAGRIPFYVKLNKKAKKALKRKGVKKFALKVAFAVTDREGNQLKKVTKKSTLR